MIDQPWQILLVEDDPAHAELVRRAFEMRGDAVRLQVAATLAEARSCLDAPPRLPHLIISDWRLPDGDGLDLLGDERLLNVPVVIMTSHGNERLAVGALKAGALDYVVKSETTLLDMPHVAERVLREWEIRAERERMQQALRESEARFRLLAENSTDVISRHAVDGTCLYVSPAVRTLLGYDPLAVSGQSALTMVHPADRAQVRHNWQRLLAGTAGDPLRFRIRHQAGSDVWLESNGRAIRNAGTGEVEEVHLSSRDITERKQAESQREAALGALRASEEKFNKAFRSSPVAVSISDSVTHRYLEVNDAFTRLTGYAREELVGRAARDLNLWVDREERAQVMGQMDQQGYVHGQEVHFRCHSGDIRAALLSLETVELNGLPCLLTTIHDITERRRAEDALRESEQKFRTIIEQSTEGFLLVDGEGRIIEWNHAQSRISGVSREEAVGCYFWDMQLRLTISERRTPERLTYFKQTALAALRTGESPVFDRPLEAILEKPNGERRDIEQTMFLIKTDTGYRIGSMTSDITERKQADAALRASEDRFRSLVQNSQDIVTVHDRNLVVTYESPSVSYLLGYEPGYLVGKTPFEFMPPEDAARVKQEFEEVAQRSNDGLPSEFRFRRADGSYIYLDALGSNLLDHPGVNGIVITSRDVTERKRAEGALRRYMERLAILHEIDQAILSAKSIEEIADAALSRIQRSVPSWRVKVILFDFETALATVVAYYCDGTKLPAGERLPLTALGPAISLRPGELVVINDLSELLAPSASQRRRINDGARSSIDAPLIVLGQQIGLLSVDATQWDAFQGEVADVVREVADQLAVAIQNARLLEQTQRHAHELEQRVAERTRELAAANERLTELDRLKSKFVSDVSHELRTPIANLKLHVELLEHGRVEKHAHYLTVVKQQSRRLGQLVDDILNLSRLEMGRDRVTLGSVDLNFLVEQIVAAHQPRAESAGLALSFEPRPGLQPVRGEVNQLAQVVTNLITNALNYTTTGAVRVGTSQSDLEACLQVEDTGMGIDPDDLSHIFDRFYRGRRSQRSETPGTGLGLAIVKEIVDLHDGRIEVNSQVRRGTAFKVWLPLFCEGGDR